MWWQAQPDAYHSINRWVSWHRCFIDGLAQWGHVIVRCTNVLHYYWPLWCRTGRATTCEGFSRPHRNTTYVDAAYCYRPCSVVCPSVCHSTEPYNKSSAVAEMGDRLATRDIGRKEGAAVPPLEGVLGLHLAQCGLGRGRPPCHVASWSIQPFGHNTRAEKWGGTVPRFGGSWIPI